MPVNRRRNAAKQGSTRGRNALTDVDPGKAMGPEAHASGEWRWDRPRDGGCQAGSGWTGGRPPGVSHPRTPVGYLNQSEIDKRTGKTEGRFYPCKRQAKQAECVERETEGGRCVENWDEIRTAFQVARLGTVSGAAEVLGVHHATVIRHIDALERRLGEKLFQRHARGYTATEAGRDLMAVAQVTQDQFAQLASRIKGQGETVSGELVVTAITGMGGLLTPVLTSFQEAYPGLVVRFLTGQRLFRLDFGEAHVAIRAGSTPSEPDNVVQPFVRLRHGLYAAQSYVARHGLPKDEAGLSGHRFIANDDPENRAPFHIWLRDRVPEAAIRYRSTEAAALTEALRSGAGLGFLSAHEAALIPDLIEVMAPRPEWEAPLWLVTHVDLHRTLKVQRFLAHLKQAALQWTDLEQFAG